MYNYINILQRDTKRTNSDFMDPDKYQYIVSQRIMTNVLGYGLLIYHIYQNIAENNQWFDEIY